MDSSRSAAHLNHDGWVDTRDITLLTQSGGGAQPAVGNEGGLGWWMPRRRSRVRPRFARRFVCMTETS